MNLRDKKVRLLREARRLIAAGEKLYVCDAVRCADGNESMRWRASAACDEITDWIDTLLGGRFCLHQWLEAQGFFLPEADDRTGVDNRKARHPKMRQTRLNWIDWMIEEVLRCG